jgi:hypothetical protein
MQLATPTSTHTFYTPPTRPTHPCGKARHPSLPPAIAIAAQTQRRELKGEGSVVPMPDSPLPRLTQRPVSRLTMRNTPAERLAGMLYSAAGAGVSSTSRSALLTRSDTPGRSGEIETKSQSRVGNGSNPAMLASPPPPPGVEPSAKALDGIGRELKSLDSAAGAGQALNSAARRELLRQLVRLEAAALADAQPIECERLVPLLARVFEHALKAAESPQRELKALVGDVVAACGTSGLERSEVAAAAAGALVTVLAQAKAIHSAADLMFDGALVRELLDRDLDPERLQDFTRGLLIASPSAAVIWEDNRFLGKLIQGLEKRLREAGDYSPWQLHAIALPYLQSLGLRRMNPHTLVKALRPLLDQWTKSDPAVLGAGVAAIWDALHEPGCGELSEPVMCAVHGLLRKLALSATFRLHLMCQLALGCGLVARATPAERAFLWSIDAVVSARPLDDPFQIGLMLADDLRWQPGSAKGRSPVPDAWLSIVARIPGAIRRDASAQTIASLPAVFAAFVNEALVPAWIPELQASLLMTALLREQLHRFDLLDALARADAAQDVTFEDEEADAEPSAAPAESSDVQALRDAYRDSRIHVIAAHLNKATERRDRSYVLHSLERLAAVVNSLEGEVLAWADSRRRNPVSVLTQNSGLGPALDLMQSTLKNWCDLIATSLNAAATGDWHGLVVTSAHRAAPDERSSADRDAGWPEDVQTEQPGAHALFEQVRTLQKALSA